MTLDSFNIILIVFDTARARNIPLYGYHRDTTPNLQKLASDGVVYQQAISPSPWSLPGHASLFTGCNPSEHGAHAKTQILPEESETLAQVLKKNEYKTHLDN